MAAASSDTPFEHPPLQHGYPLPEAERSQLREILERRRSTETAAHQEESAEEAHEPG
jgi:hypothetical protein